MSDPILDLQMQPNDADADTIRTYLTTLLLRVWDAGEGFSGKRPFGNSGWEWDLYAPLIKAGLVKGTLDSDGFIEELEEEAKASALIREAIERMCA